MISIIIPVYNKERYIEQCFRSISNQTYSDYEVIVVDDGSTDNSFNVCLDYSANDCRYKVYHTPNRGVCAARNYGLKLSKGEYVIFIDCDDSLREEFLDVLLRNMVEHDVDVSMCGLQQVFLDGRVRNVYGTRALTVLSSQKEILSTFFSESLFGISVCTKLFKRSSIGDVRFCDGRRMHEDKYFLFQALLASKKICIEDITLYVYYERQNSTVTKRMNDSIHDIEFFAKQMSEYDYDDVELASIAMANYINSLLEVIRLIYSSKANKSFYWYAVELSKKVLLADVANNFRYLSKARLAEIMLLKTSRQLYKLLLICFLSLRLRFRLSRKREV